MAVATENLKAYLEPEEVARLEEAAQYLRDKLLVRLYFRLGCRNSEGRGILLTGIDYQRGTITIEHLKKRLDLSCPQCGKHLAKEYKLCPVCGTSVEQAIAKEKEKRHFRTLPVDQETLAMLKEYIDRGGAVTRDGKTYLFEIGRHRAWQIVTECARRAGLPKLVNPQSGLLHNVSPHKLRDAFAVNAVKHDDSMDGIRHLQEHLGHQSFNTTMRYRKLSGEEQQEWYQKLWQGGQENGQIHQS